MIFLHAIGSNVYVYPPIDYKTYKTDGKSRKMLDQNDFQSKFVLTLILLFDLSDVLYEYYIYHNIYLQNTLNIFY